MTTTDALWTLVDALHGDMEDDPHPERSFTVQQYAERYGLAYPTAQGRLKRFVQSGKLAEGWKRETNAYKRAQLIRCYWVP